MTEAEDAEEPLWEGLPGPQRLFLETLAGCGMVSHAASIAKVGRSTVYYWRKTSEDFAEAMDAAERIAAYELEEEARRRALDADQPNDKLLMFVLRGLVPEKFDRAVLKDVEETKEAPRTTVVVHLDTPKEPK